MATQCIGRRNDCLYGVSNEKTRGKQFLVVMEGKYVLTFKGLTKEGVFDHIVTVSRTDFPDRCIQAIALHAAKNEYHQDYSVRGYTACKLLLDGRQEIFRAISSYMDDGHWYDWCLIGWVDDGVENTFPACILGFFDMDHSGSSAELIDSVYVVIESSHDVVSMDALSQSSVKKFKMPTSSKLADSTYLIPVSTIANPLCVFKNYGGSVNEFFCASPRRKWSRYFSAQIGISRETNSKENVKIERSNSSCNKTTPDDVSLHLSESSSHGSIDDFNNLDFGDSSDDSSEEE